MHDRMADERLTEIEQREQAATEGPWESDESDLCWRLHGVAGRLPAQAGGWLPEQVVTKQILKAPKRNTPYAEYWPEPADAEFIVHARQDVRDLLAEVKRLRAELEETQDRGDADRAALADARAEECLSMRQRSVLASIRESIQRRGYPPTVREIGAAVGVTSTSTVAHHLRALEARGFIERDPAIRGIRLTAPEPAEAAS